MPPEKIVVDRRGVRQRVDRYLAALGHWGSRAQVQRIITAGGVRIDGEPVSADTVLRQDQEIEIAAAPPPPPQLAEPEQIPLTILHEDAWLLVLDKAAGLVVHPAAGNWRGTLVNALLHHWGGPRPGLDELRPGIVHRLDKDTSGVLVVAKDADTLRRLSDQFRCRDVRKQYLAIVRGVPQPRCGAIDKPLGRHPIDRKRMAIRTNGGREAFTAYETVASDGAYAVLRLHPRTGRTHQIRVHLAAIGCPIVGDRVYGGDDGTAMARQALHAEAIEFEHPGTGARLRFSAPLPADMDEFRAAIERR